MSDADRTMDRPARGYGEPTDLETPDMDRAIDADMTDYAGDATRQDGGMLDRAKGVFDKGVGSTQDDQSSAKAGASLDDADQQDPTDGGGRDVDRAM